MARTKKVVEIPPVWEARQVSSDKDSDWVLTNTFNTNDVRVVSNEEFENRYKGTRTSTPTQKPDEPQESDAAPLVPQENPVMHTSFNPPVENND